MEHLERLVISELQAQPAFMTYRLPALEPPLGVPVIGMSESEIATFKDCPRRWFLHYYLGFQGDQSSVTSNAKLGTRVHVALQGYYGHGMDPMKVIRAVYQRETEFNPAAGEALAKEFDMAVTMLDGYAEWLTETGADRALIPVAAEMGIHYPLGVIEGWYAYLRGHLDVIVFDQHTSRYMFMDHKTVAAFDSANLLLINEQMKMYVMLQRLIAKNQGTEVNGGIFNMLKRSKRTSRAAPPFYKREPVAYNDADMTSMWRRTNYTVTKILITRNALDQVYRGESPDPALMEQIQQTIVGPRWDHDCSWKCPFLLQCPLMDDGSRWLDALQGRYSQGDPYAYYGRSLLEELAAEGRI